MTIQTYVKPLRHSHPVLSAFVRLPFASKTRRDVSSTASSFIDLATRVSSRFQIYISQSHDPFLNLSIEHYLLQKTPIASTVLFLYVNEPCVIIGRNQNPWLEADLQVLAAGGAKVPTSTITKHGNAGLSGPIQLLRRRSGGGTVFHDYGNMNYSVICPTTNFTRDKHTEMVVQAIRVDNSRARVNERHDIVLDQGQRLPAGSIPDPRDMYKTAYSIGVNELSSLKVSGSAYKLTRTRSLHHGTCLLNSPNLDLISRCLQSPARFFIKARGVESVRSPVSNIYSGSEVEAHSRFQAHMLAAFSSLYGLETDFMDAFSVLHEYAKLKCGNSWVAGYLTACLLEIPEIRVGVRELKVCLHPSYGVQMLIYCQSHQNGFTGRHHNLHCPPIPLEMMK